MKNELNVKHKDGSYDIIFQNSFDKLNETLEKFNIKEKQLCIITDSNVDKLYGDELLACLKDSAKQISKYVIAAGEENKNLNTVASIYEFLISNHITRNDMLIAFGGGVVGDITGFTAATYLRGIPFIQIPTTLLAQVDSSVGGKTGVDFNNYKNMVGAFYMPVFVYMNHKLLKSLDERQFASGFAETMKYGLIKDEDFYGWLLENMYDIEDRDEEILKEMVYRSCDWKRKIVEKDPNEKGERALLNFGHTIGHAIEKAMDFKLAHGECVALGSVAAAYISYKHGHIEKEEYLEIRDMFVPFHLPITMTNISAQEVLNNTKSDKKVLSGILSFILLNEIGDAFIDRTVTDEDILEAVEELIYKPEG